MATATWKIGPRHHGRQLTLAEFRNADFQSGYQYELIDGRLYVTYMPAPPQDYAEKWLLMKLWLYTEAHPEVINYVTDKAEVYVPRRRRPTWPQPDLAAYANYPIDTLDIDWGDVSPLLVGEVVSVFDPKKDLERNVKLYLQVPSIKEFWLLDNRKTPDRPTMRVHRRHGSKWRIIDLPFGETYQTKLLPDFKLVIDLRK